MSEPKDTNGYIAESISFDADAKKSNKNTLSKMGPKQSNQCTVLILSAIISERSHLSSPLIVEGLEAELADWPRHEWPSGGGPIAR